MRVMRRSLQATTRVQYRLDKNNWSRNGSINTSIILRPERKCFSFLRFLSGVFEYFYCDSPYLNGIDRKGTPLLYANIE